MTNSKIQIKKIYIQQRLSDYEILGIDNNTKNKLKFLLTLIATNKHHIGFPLNKTFNIMEIKGNSYVSFHDINYRENANSHH